MKPSFVAACLAPFLNCAAPVVAQPKAPAPPPPNYWGTIVGNWKVEFRDNQGQPAGVGEFAFHPGPKGQYTAGSSGVVRTASAGNEYRRYVCNGTLSGGAIELVCDPYYVRIGFTYVTLQAAGNTLRGWWGGEKDKREGTVTFSRVTPVIESVEVIKENEQRLRLRLRGKEMPIWVELYAGAVVDASIDDPKYHVQWETWPSTGDRIQRWKEGYLDVVVNLESPVEPGRKVITLNGARKEFDVKFGTPRQAAAGKLKGLRYVELKDGKYVPIDGELKHGATFFVEASFDDKPAQAEYTVKLDWGTATGAEVRVKASEDAKVYRSEPIRLQSPTVNR